MITGGSTNRHWRNNIRVQERVPIVGGGSSPWPRAAAVPSEARGASRSVDEGGAHWGSRAPSSARSTEGEPHELSGSRRGVGGKAPSGSQPPKRTVPWTCAPSFLLQPGPWPRRCAAGVLACLRAGGLRPGGRRRDQESGPLGRDGPGGLVRWFHPMNGIGPRGAVSVPGPDGGAP